MFPESKVYFKSLCCVRLEAAVSSIKFLLLLMANVLQTELITTIVRSQSVGVFLLIILLQHILKMQYLDLLPLLNISMTTASKGVEC